MYSLRLSVTTLPGAVMLANFHSTETAPVFKENTKLGLIILIRLQGQRSAPHFLLAARRMLPYFAIVVDSPHPPLLNSKEAILVKRFLK